MNFPGGDPAKTPKTPQLALEANLEDENLGPNPPVPPEPDNGKRPGSPAKTDKPDNQPGRPDREGDVGGGGGRGKPADVVSDLAASTSADR